MAQIVQTAATAEGSEKGAEQSPAKAPLSQRRQASATAASDPAADEAARGMPLIQVSIDGILTKFLTHFPAAERSPSCIVLVFAKLE